MPKVKEKKLANFDDFVKTVSSYQASHEIAWFRGVGEGSRKLLPTIARPAGTRTPEDIVGIEKRIGAAFAQRSPPFVNLRSRNPMHELFFMQHYGIPTRLLDWSESPFVALYFSLTSGRRDQVTGAPESDAAVWLCAPVPWNQAALSHLSFTGGVLDESCEELKSYQPSVDLEQRTLLPVMMYGTHNSPRIVAQRGVFAIFGKGLAPMEDLASKAPFPSGVLKKLVIEKDNIIPMLNSLLRNGVSESVIYPDLFGLSMEIRRLFGY